MYFNNPGKSNTTETLTLAFERAKRFGIEEIVVASSRGQTALKALEIFQGYKIIVVSLQSGFEEPFQLPMDPRTRLELEAKGLRVLSSTHALSGVERAVAKKHGGVYPALLIADTLRLFGQGTKVAVEVSIMAADAGLLSGGDIIAIGGTSQGADTALVLRPAGNAALFDIRIREIICKPSKF